jgi:hypothetical protein
MQLDASPRDGKRYNPAAFRQREGTSMKCFSARLTVLLAALFVAPWPAFPQAGSTGGTIGKHDKSVSGGDDQERRPEPNAKRRQSATARPDGGHGKGCPDITGVWNSWASGMFGKGDATFNKDGTATHKSGIPGTWRCENGQLRMGWNHKEPSPASITTDGKTIIDSDGKVVFSRD